MSATPDNFTPDVGQRIDPAGRVTYDFDAHLHARGVDLDDGGGPAAPEDRRVRWLRTSDGSMIASVYGYHSAEGDTLLLESYENGGGLGARNSGVRIVAGAIGSVTAYAGSNTAFGPTIINAAGESSFITHGLGALGKIAISGLYQVDSGLLGPSDTATATLTHSLGRTVYPLVAPQDVNNGGTIEWNYVPVNANQIDLHFWHTGLIGANAQLLLNIFLVTVT